MSNRKFTLSKFHAVKNWYHFLTSREKLVPIRHVIHTNISHFAKNACVVKLYVAYIRILHTAKIPPDLLHLAFDSNSSHESLNLGLRIFGEFTISAETVSISGAKKHSLYPPVKIHVPILSAPFGIMQK